MIALARKQSYPDTIKFNVETEFKEGSRGARFPWGRNMPSNIPTSITCTGGTYSLEEADFGRGISSGRIYEGEVKLTYRMMK